jgi:multicomponent Na+:H+ antiporter subunit F
MLAWQSPLIMRCFIVLFLSASLCLYRILKGPTSADRIVAIDILGILVVGFCALLGIATHRDWYIDIGIAWALQSFISTLALAKYLEGRGFDE